MAGEVIAALLVGVILTILVLYLGKFDNCIQSLVNRMFGKKD